ncbi:MAG: peptidylprolyl isomerase [Bacteroidales bacterium]
MSVLQTLREKAGWLVAVVIGVALLIFVVSDFFGSGGGGQRQARKHYEIAQIGGESVSYIEFDERLQHLIEIYRLSGTPNITEDMAETLRSQIWEQLVREKILEREFSRLGLEVSDEEVEELVMGDNKHPIVTQLFLDPQTGMFNESYLVNFLKQTEIDPAVKTYWLFFEDEIVTDRLNTKYNNLVAKGLHVTNLQAEFEYNLVSRSVDFTYIGKYYNSVSDSLVSVSSDEVRKYYSARKEEYRRPALRSMEYVTFDVIPSEDDYQQALRWINERKEEFEETDEPVQYINITADNRHAGFYYTADQLPESVREFALAGDKSAVFGPFLEDDTYNLARIIDIAERPDSVRARHILLSAGPDKTMAMVREEADSLLNEIRGGMNFEIMAMIASEDQGSSQVGGDLGWFSEGMMVTPFNDACFSGTKGDMVITETNYGIHIIEILDQSRRVRKYDIGFVDRQVIPGSATIQKIYGEASQFASNNPNYEKFSQTVAEEGLNKRIATDISASQKEIAGIENARGLIMALFQTEKERIVLDFNQQAVIDLGDMYVIAYCTEVQEEGYADINDVVSEIRFTLMNRKKADLIAAEFSSKMNEGMTIEQIARDMGLQIEESAGITFRSFSVQGMAGIEPALISAAIISPEGEIAGPVEGSTGVYLLSVNNAIELSTEDVDAVLDRLSGMMQIRASYELFEALRKEAGIVDKRHRFF